jgi:phage/plasmid-associated DNA primase
MISPNNINSSENVTDNDNNFGSISSSNVIKYTNEIYSKGENIKTIEDYNYESICKITDCFEVTDDDRPIKWYFDVETSGDYDDDKDYNMLNMCEPILTICKDTINEFCSVYLNVEPIYSVTSSHSAKYKDYVKNKYMWKISYHITIQNVLGLKTQQKVIIENLNIYAKQKYDVSDYIKGGNLFDETVYSRNRKMRSLYASKPDENRKFVIVEGTFNDSIITSFIPENYVLLPEFEVVEKITTPFDGINDNDENMKFVNMCLDNGLFVERSKNYTDWLHMGLAIKNTFGEEAYPLFETFSKLAFSNLKQYEEVKDKNKDHWDNWTPRVDNSLTIGSIKFWAKTENEEIYNKINKSIMDDILKDDKKIVLIQQIEDIKNEAIKNKSIKDQNYKDDLKRVLIQQNEEIKNEVIKNKTIYNEILKDDLKRVLIQQTEEMKKMDNLTDTEDVTISQDLITVSDISDMLENTTVDDLVKQKDLIAKQIKIKRKNEKKQEKLIDKNEDEKIKELAFKYLPFIDLDTHKGCIDLIRHYAPDDFMWVKNTLYCWNGTKWKNKPDAIVVYISENISFILSKIIFKVKKELDPTIEINIKTIDYLEKIVCGARHSYKDNNFCKNVVDMSKSFFSRDDVEFDNIDYLLGFNDGCFDLIQNKFRAYKFNDYMTMTCGYNYKDAIKFKQEDYDEFIKVITLIMPDDKKRKLLLEILSCGLIGRAIEIFVIFNSSGRSGKGLLDELLRLVLGDYQLIYADIKILTQPSKSGANPEIAKIHKKRYVAFREPDATLTLQNDVVKDLTGGGNLSARMLYSNDCETILHNITVLECNERPKFKTEPSHAEFERIIDLKFPHNFTSNDDDVDNITMFKINPLYKTTEWQIKMRGVFLVILIENFINFKENKYILSIPDDVRVRGQEYLNESFPLIEFFYENYQKTGDNTNILQLENIFTTIKYSQSYSNLNKSEKRRYNKKYIYNFFSTNRLFRNDYRERHNNGIKQHRNILLGYTPILTENI